MANNFDRASCLEEEHRQKAINSTRADIPPGVEGECCRCGEFSQRLIRGACAPCRDKYKLP